MILKENLSAVGRAIKPHGVRGEIFCAWDFEEFFLSENDFLILEMDGIFVPFFIENVRTKSDGLLIKFYDIESETQAKIFASKTLFVNKEKVPQETKVQDLRYFIGFKIVDETAGDVGEILDVNTDTANALFVLDGKLIPVAEEFILDIDHQKRVIFCALPGGLLNL